MLIQILRAKIHHLTITDADLNYIGSLTLDEDIMDAVKMFEYEKIHVVNVNNGERLETYLIKGKRGSGICCLNGPAARKGMKGDTIIVLSYGTVEIAQAQTWYPLVLHPLPGNIVPPDGVRDGIQKK